MPISRYNFEREAAEAAAAKAAKDKEEAEAAAAKAALALAEAEYVTILNKTHLQSSTLVFLRHKYTYTRPEMFSTSLLTTQAPMLTSSRVFQHVCVLTLLYKLVCRHSIRELCGLSLRVSRVF